MRSARLLREGDAEAVRGLLAADPVLNVFVASRVEAGLLGPGTPGELWGYPAEKPRSLLHVGANLVPVAMDAEARRAFVGCVGPHRMCSAIVGAVAEAIPLWEALSGAYGPAYRRTRAIRRCQPVMAISTACAVAADPRVRAITHAEGESYFAAAVAMYTEELDEDPLTTNPYGYRRYVDSLIDTDRAFGIVVGGQVIFKADIGAMGGGVAQVQGVWVRRDLRGRGLAAPAMAAVTNLIVRSGRTASLYVNEYNAPALATYRRCGYTVRGHFATVLY